MSSLEDLANAAIARSKDLSAFAALEGTVTILFSDIENSSLLYERLGDKRAHEAISAHNEIFRREVAAHRGYEVKSLGDGFMIAFSGARRAVACAIALQRAFAAYGVAHPDLPIQVRIGLHVGEAIRDSSDLFGGAVILASRVVGAAKGGQILISSTLHDLIARTGDIQFDPAGEQEFKGFEGKQRLYEVAWR